MAHLLGENSAKLLEGVGGPERMVAMCDRFYKKVFKDSHINKFVTDESEPHAQRLGLWLAEKMGGKPYWSRIRHPDDRSRSHAKAWRCPRREMEKMGQRFKLDDCRIWMRLMYWAGREEGLDKHREFWQLFKKIIGYGIGIYEYTAPAYYIESAAWSNSERKIAEYVIENKRVMKDVIGVGVRR